MSETGPPPVSLRRIAPDAPDYAADDMSGKGAEVTGGRWNRKGTPVIYVAVSRALACLESVVHVGAGDLPLNRYLVEIRVPFEVWDRRTTFDPAAHVGWDAEPPGTISLDWGTRWARDAATLLAAVPSVIVPEEPNILINPRHADARTLDVRKIRKWTYDGRLHVRSTVAREARAPD